MAAFLVVWAPFTLWRWGVNVALPHGWVVPQAAFFAFYPVLLIVPWSRIHKPVEARVFYGVLVAATLVFTLALVLDMLFLHTWFAGTGVRPPSPLLPGVLAFIALLQIPAALFARRPDLLD